MKIEMTKNELKFFNAYRAAIDFTETGGERQPAPGADLDADFLRESAIDCLAFYSRVACYLSDEELDQAGHDFWLTRNGHGVGFWDRPEVWGDYRAGMLSKIAASFGEVCAVFDELPDCG